MEENYLQWLGNYTPTRWWHDSADPSEVKTGLAHGATGVTTNPILVSEALRSAREYWSVKLGDLSGMQHEQKAEAILKLIICRATKLCEPQFLASKGEHGYVCAQVNPSLACNAGAMIEMAKRFSTWAPNISVKLPATMAGLEAIEECAAESISVTATVSFSVSQVISVARKYQRGAEKAQKSGRKKGRAFAVIMIGRIDDYLREIAQDTFVDVDESDIRQAGIAITKRAYSIFKANGFETKLLIAALRGTHHMHSFTGAELIMSIHPKYQKMLLAPSVPREACGISKPVDEVVIKKLMRIPDFTRAYEPDGMGPVDFASFGLMQRTLTQFCLAGWNKIENFEQKASHD